MLLPAAVCAGFAFLYNQSLCALLSCMQPDSEPLAVNDFLNLQKKCLCRLGVVLIFHTQIMLWTQPDLIYAVA